MILRLIFYPLRLLNEVLRRDCSWRLRDYELRLIEASATKLNSANRLILTKQLASQLFVERMHQDRITRIHFHWPESIAKLDLPKDCRLARLKLKHDRRSLSVSIEAYNGLVFALQYSKPPKPLVLGNFDIVSAEHGGEGDEGIPRSIDREEHDFT